MSNWSLYSIILDKKNILQKNLNGVQKDRLYNLMTYTLLSNIDFSNTNFVNLNIDKCKTGKRVNDFDKYIRSNLELSLPIASKIDIAHKLSQNNTGIQSVDIFCYGLFRKHEYSDTDWYDNFKDKIKFEHIFVPK